MNSTLNNLRTYSNKEELWSSIIHGLGIALSVVALIIMIILTTANGNSWAIISTAIFGVTMVMLYTASTMYHAVSKTEVKIKLKKLDHISIYYLIAGTYTPFLLVNLRGTLGWTIFGIIWGLALLGTLLKLKSSSSGTKAWSIGLYLIMGWMIVIASKELVSALPRTGLLFLIAGGMFYTLGVFFYIWKSREYTHAIWHFFVLNGTTMHFFAVLYSCILI